MRSILTLALFLFISVNTFAQFKDINMGIVPLEEVKMTSFPDDPEAEAVVLYDKGFANFFTSRQGGLDLHFTRKVRIKILKKTGLERANIQIALYQDRGTREEIKDIQAFSHTFKENDGLVVKKLSPAKIFTEQIDEKYSLIKFAIPGVEENSVIEYEYTKVSPFIDLPDWEFQSTIPVVYSEYMVHVTPFYSFQYIFQGRNRFDEYESHTDNRNRSFGGIPYKTVVYRMAMKDLEAFRDESYITSIEDYLVKIDWQLSKITRTDGTSIEYLSSWPKIISSLDKHDNFGKFIKAGSRQAKGIYKSDLNVDGMSQLQAAQAIEKYVKENFSWNGYTGKYAQTDLKDFMKTRSGWSSDINLFLIGMYRAAGIEAYPVILSTRDHGKVKMKYPFASFFNTVAVMLIIDGNRYLSEGTESNLRFGKLPPRYLNEVGLVIDPGKEEWINLNMNVPSIKVTQLRSTIDPDAVLLNTDFTFQMTDYDAVSYRINPDLMKERLNKSYDLQTEVKHMNTNSNTKPVIYTFSASAPLDFFEGKYYITPFLGEAITSNPIRGSKRDYPIDFLYSYTREYASEFSIPEGYKVSSIPEDLSFTNEVMDFNYSAVKGDTKVIVRASYTLKKAVYSPQEFNRLRHFLGQAADKFKEQIEVEKAQ